jgi:hypothetical protein
VVRAAPGALHRHWDGCLWSPRLGEEGLSAQRSLRSTILLCLCVYRDMGRAGQPHRWVQVGVGKACHISPGHERPRAKYVIDCGVAAKAVAPEALRRCPKLVGIELCSVLSLKRSGRWLRYNCEGGGVADGSLYPRPCKTDGGRTSSQHCRDTVRSAVPADRLVVLSICGGRRTRCHRCGLLRLDAHHVRELGP